MESMFNGRQVGIRIIKEKGAKESLYIKGPADVDRLLSSLRERDREHFVVILLNTKNRVLGVDVASVGILDAALISPREVFKAAILLNSAGVILGHNHPSGDTKPSQEDLKITRQLIDAGKLMDIAVLDHVIIGDGYNSLRESGLIEF